MRVRGVTLVAVASMAALALVGLAVRSFGVAESNGLASPPAEILAFVVGVWLPLFALIYACVRNRVAVVVLAFCVGLSVNLVFLTHATPAAAVTDNSSVFTFENSTTFSPPNANMRQNYTPTSPTATTCPGAGGFNWQCSWTSDTFTTGQTLSAGTAQVDLYGSNTNAGIVRKSQGGIQHTSNDCGAGLGRPAVANGDVLMLACTYRTGATIASAPSGWSLVSAQVDATSAISLVVYAHVITDASSEPTTNSFPLTPTTSVKMLAYYMDFSGLDTANPTDGEANQSTPSGTSHTALGVTTTVANDVLLTFHTTANCVTWTAPAGMSEVLDSTGCTNGATTNVDMEINQLTLGAAGGTGDKIATNDGAAVGVTMTVALRPITAPLTCTLTVQLSKPIQFRASDSNVSATASITINKPAGVVDGNVMIASIAQGLVSSPLTITGSPAGWTLVRQSQFGVTNVYGMAVYRRVASSEPVSYTWTFSKALNSAGGISAYVNVDTTTPIDVETGGSGTPASVTTTQPGAMLVGSYMSTSNTAFTPPAGLTERADRASGASNSASVEQADVVQAVAGASGSKAPTPTASVYDILALRPAAGSFLGSETANVTGPTVGLTSVWIATPAVTFVTGERLQVDVTAPNDQANCNASVSYDSTSTPSKLTVAAGVPEGVAGLLLLAPALPLAARWWKRRRP
jgi:hypothetical protein